jgi:hypothetical protein
MTAVFSICNGMPCLRSGETTPTEHEHRAAGARGCLGAEWNTSLHTRTGACLLISGGARCGSNRGVLEATGREPVHRVAVMSAQAKQDEMNRSLHRAERRPRFVAMSM